MLELERPEVLLVATVLEVSGRVSSLGFLAASSDPTPESPVLFFSPAFLSHCWCRYLYTLGSARQNRKILLFN